MLNKGKYVNHLGQTFTFGFNGIYASNYTLRDYAWQYDSLYGKLANFHKGITDRSFTIVIHADSDEAGVALKNTVFSIFEADVLANRPGCIVDESGYKCEGFIISSEKARWLYEKKHLVINAHFLSENPNWVKVETRRYSPEHEEDIPETAKKYSYSYGGLTYTHSYFANIIKNGSIVPLDMVLRIFGPVSNPLVTVGPNAYQLNIVLATGENAEINTRAKTIVKNNEFTGTSENQFWTASNNSYIFEKIPVGQNGVMWNGSFNFEIDLIDERSEPPWT